MTNCSTFCPVIERPVEVKIPVPVACPAPPVLEVVSDPVLKWDEKTSVNAMVIDLRASRVLWRDRSKQLELILNGYRSEPK